MRMCWRLFVLAARTLRDECGGAVAPAVDSPCEAARVGVAESAPDFVLPPDFAPVLLQAAPVAADARPGAALALSLALHVGFAAGVIGLAAHQFPAGADDIEMIELVVEQAPAAAESRTETDAAQAPAQSLTVEPAVAPAQAIAHDPPPEREGELAALPLPPPAPADAAEAIARGNDTRRGRATPRGAGARCGNSAPASSARARDRAARGSGARKSRARASRRAT